MYYQALNLAEKDCIETGLNSLRQARTILDDRLELMDQIALRLENDSELKRIVQFEKPGPGCPFIYEIRQYSEKLTKDKLGVISDYLSGYWVFLKSNEFVFYNGAVSLGLDFFYSYFMKYETTSYAQWRGKLFGSPWRTLFPLEKIKTANGSFNAVTYIYPLNAGLGAETYGAVVFLISETYISGIMRSGEAGDSGGIYLIDGDNRVLCALGNAITVDSLRINGSEGYYHENGDVVILTKSQTSGLSYAASLPESAIMGKAKSIRNTAGLLITVIAVSEIAIILLFAWRNSRPLTDFIGSLKTLFTDAPGGDGEYDYLKKSLPRIKSLRTRLDQKQELVKNYFLTQLLEGFWTNPGEIYFMAKETGLDLEAKRYCAVCIDGPLPENEKGEIPPPADMGGWRLLVALRDQESDFTAWIYGLSTDEGSQDSLVKGLCEIDAQSPLPPAPGQFRRIGVGKAYPEITALNFSWDQAKSCVCGIERSGVLEYDALPYNTANFYYPLSLEQRLINATLRREAVQIEAVFAELEKENLAKRTLPPFTARYFKANLQATLLKTYGEIVSEGKTADEAILRLREHTSDNLKVFIMLARDEFMRIASRIRDKNHSDRHERLKKEIENYITENYSDINLSGYSIASNFHLSESYFSILFKDVIGVSFGDYLEDRRLIEAEKLLKENRLDIGSIAKKVGYASNATFRRAFKRSKGVSPTDYRTV